MGGPSKVARPKCKYGAECYQKNPFHLAKYSHPSKNSTQEAEERPAKKAKVEENTKNDGSKREKSPAKTTSPRPREVISDSGSDSSDEEVIPDSLEEKTQDKSDNENSLEDKKNEDKSENVDPRTTIKKSFLLEMPSDFYHLWNLSKELKPKNPSQAFEDIGLELVGPFEVLAQSCENLDDCLTKHRYYYDPPQFLTVLKGDPKTGYHIGYYYDHPEEPPVFLAKNLESTEGSFDKMGDNIFAALNLYLDDVKIGGTPFQKMSVGKYRKIIKEQAEKLDLSLDQHSAKIKARERKVVAPTLNKLGLVVPFDKKAQLGYRDLAMSSKELKTLLTKLKNAAPEQKKIYLSELQPVLTFASIALDECDFGTGVKLGVDLLFFGIDDLNPTIETFLSNSYNLLQYNAFGKIAQAHLSKRKKLHTN